MKRGTCPKCKTEQDLTRHHIKPKCHFGHTKETELICRDCHDELEFFIQKIEGKNRRGRRIKLPEFTYRNIYRLFITI